MSWDREAELQRVSRMPLSVPDRITALMHIFQVDLEVQGRTYAEAKSEHTRRKAKAIVAKRAEGEKSGEMCGYYAESQDDIYRADLAWRTAEQLVAADKEKLRILHAEMDKWRTEQANERAADNISVRTQA